MFRFILVFFTFSLLLLGMSSHDAQAEVHHASHYGMGDGLHGMPTASGEPMNAYDFTAASPYLPLGSKALVCATDGSERCVTVRINDRGPAAFTGKSLDLSWAAAMEIGLVGGGAVTLTPL